MTGGLVNFTNKNCSPNPKCVEADVYILMQHFTQIWSTFKDLKNSKKIGRLCKNDHFITDKTCVQNYIDIGTSLFPQSMFFSQILLKIYLVIYSLFGRLKLSRTCAWATNANTLNNTMGIIHQLNNFQVKIRSSYKCFNHDICLMLGKKLEKGLPDFIKKQFLKCGTFKVRVSISNELEFFFGIFNRIATEVNAPRATNNFIGNRELKEIFVRAMLWAICLLFREDARETFHLASKALEIMQERLFTWQARHWRSADGVAIRDIAYEQSNYREIKPSSPHIDLRMK
ncbi:hypothetical protein ACJX0J_022486, partial [Zea mays]